MIQMSLVSYTCAAKNDNKYYTLKLKFLDRIVTQKYLSYLIYLYLDSYKS